MKFYVFDWDDTLQKFLKPTGSMDFLLKTLFYHVPKRLIRTIIGSDNMMIITARPKLYTFAVRLKCFMVTKDPNCFSDTKITTINPNFFYHGQLKDSLVEINHRKTELAKLYQATIGNHIDVCVSFDSDLPGGSYENLFHS